MPQKKGKRSKSKEDILKRIEKERKEIEELISILEDTYRKGMVTEETYREVKTKNLERLKVLKNKLSRLFGKKKEEESVEKKKEKEKEGEGEKFTGFKTAQPQPQPKVEPKSNFAEKYLIELERIKALLETFKESKRVMDERIQRLSESIGEIRSMVMQRESDFRKLEADFHAIVDVISELKPQKYLKELEKIRAKVSSFETKVEKVEVMSTEALRNVKRLNEVLMSIGNLENLASMNKILTEKMKEIETLSRNIQKISQNVERIYMEFKTRLDEFDLLKSKVSMIESDILDIRKNLDELIMKSTEFVDKKEFGALRDTIGTLEQAVAELEKSVKENVSEEKETILELLKSLEEEFREGKISEEDYLRMKEENLKKLRELERKTPLRIKTKKEEKAESQEPKELPKELTPKRELEKKEEGESRINRREFLKRKLEEMFKKGLISESTFKRAIAHL